MSYSLSISGHTEDEDTLADKAAEFVADLDGVTTASFSGMSGTRDLVAHDEDATDEEDGEPEATPA